VGRSGRPLGSRKFKENSDRPVSGSFLFSGVFGQAKARQITVLWTFLAKKPYRPAFPAASGGFPAKRF
jgi:hypothetical protein